LDNSKKDFFKTIVNLYTREGYLYQKLNKFLREYEKNELKNIKFYYTCLLASFYYFSKKTELKSLLNENKQIIVYRGSLFTNEEFQSYKLKNMKNIVRIFREFLSTSIIKDIPNIYFDKKSNDNQFLWEIKIPFNLIENEPFNFADISEASEFINEKGV